MSLANQNAAKIENLPAELKWRNWIILSGLVVAALVWTSWRFALGVLMGGVLVNVNFHLLHRHLVNLLMVKRTSKGLIARSLLRLFITGLILAVLLQQKWIDVFGLLLGLSVVVLNLSILTMSEIKSLVFHVGGNK